MLVLSSHMRMAASHVVHHTTHPPANTTPHHIKRGMISLPIKGIQTLGNQGIKTRKPTLYRHIFLTGVLTGIAASISLVGVAVFCSYPLAPRSHIERTANRFR